MIDTSKRKKEIFNIAATLNTILDEEGKNLMSAVTFPRIYSHYERFVLESLEYLINEIFEKDNNILDLTEEIKLFLFLLSKNTIKVEKVIDALNLLDESYSVKKLEKKVLLSNLKNANPHECLEKYLKALNMGEHQDFAELTHYTKVLGSKYRARCEIAHGNEKIDSFTFKDWLASKEILIKFFDLLQKMIEDYLTNETHLKKIF